jgi:hypothetical protein
MTSQDGHTNGAGTIEFPFAMKMLFLVTNLNLSKLNSRNRSIKSTIMYILQVNVIFW